MPKISELQSKTLEKSDYTLIGNGSLIINKIAKNFSPQPKFQIIHLESEEKVIRKNPFAYILLDGTDYRNTEFSKIHDYFNGDIPNLVNKAIMLELNNKNTNIFTQNSYKNHSHIVDIKGNKTINIEVTETSEITTHIAGSFEEGNSYPSDFKLISKGTTNGIIEDINYQTYNEIVPSSKIVNYYCKMKMD